MTPTGVFDRVVCGVDGTPESLEAVRQAIALIPEGAAVHLVSVLDLAPAASIAWVAPEMAPAMTVRSSEALERALEVAPGATTHSVDGAPPRCLLEEIERMHATLVAVGTRGVSRTEGILLGTTTARMLHDAPCSVLVARSPVEGEFAPRAIVVGVDGSEESALAAGAALELSRRLGARVRGLTALGGKDIRLDVARSLAPDLVVDKSHSPVEALVTASNEANLLVVGSRGLHGLRSLGSVSERVAHRAPCSVLVVRAPR
jgi:nucleotide-binding universal stress UspA family protein